MTMPWSRVALALCGIVVAVAAGMLTAIVTAEPVYVPGDINPPIVQEYAAHTE